MNKKLASLIAGAAAGVLLGITQAHAGPLASIYFTNSAAGKENSAVVPIPAGGLVKTFWACNYSTTGGMALMAFDASSLPANGANPAFPVVSLPEATATTNFASCANIVLPSDGYQVQKGFVLACSTTGAQLTVDTTSGGDCKFWAAH